MKSRIYGQHLLHRENFFRNFSLIPERFPRIQTQAVLRPKLPHAQARQMFHASAAAQFLPDIMAESTDVSALGTVHTDTHPRKLHFLD